MTIIRGILKENPIFTICCRKESAYEYPCPAQAEFPETLRLRRHFHENPELSCREVNTIAFLEAYLKDLGIPTINVPDGGFWGSSTAESPERPCLCGRTPTLSPLPKVRKI